MQHVYSEQKQFFHDVAYDYHGKRLASASGTSIQVWDTDANGQWQCSEEIKKAHFGSVHKLAWAHPEFGQVLASCSADRVVNIYEEQVDTRTNQRAWKRQARLVDSREALQDVEFSPRHHGLKLATISLDGKLRIYEAPDLINLSNWNAEDQVDVGAQDCRCLAWNPSPFDEQMLAAGADKTVKIFQRVQKYNRWQVVAALVPHQDTVNDVAWAPDMGRSYHLLATACKDGAVRIWKMKRAGGTYDVEMVAQLTDHKAEVWRVSWNVTGTILASTGDDGSTRLWKSELKGQWKPILTAVDQSKA